MKKTCLYVFNISRSPVETVSPVENGWDDPVYLYGQPSVALGDAREELSVPVKPQLRPAVDDDGLLQPGVYIGQKIKSPTPKEDGKTL